MITLRGGDVEEGAHGLDARLHGQQHPADVGVLDDRDALFGVGADLSSLHPFPGVTQSMLVGGFGDGHTFHADTDTCRVHHGEHVAHPLPLLPDQVADRPVAPVTEAEDTGRGGVDTELVLQGDHLQVVPLTGPSLVVGDEFGDQEHGDPPGPGRGARGPGEDEVDDILGQVVVAPSDEDLGPEQSIGPVGLRDRLGAKRPHVGSGLRLGEVHGARPLTTD